MGKVLSEKKSNIRTLLLIFVGGVYIAVGAAVFSLIEKREEVTRREQLLEDEIHFKHMYNISDEVFRNLTTLVMELEPHKSGVQWGFVGALYFAITVVTTIGYGHSVPRTASGKIFCMFYAMVGIPLYLVLVQAMGERINHAAKYFLKVIGHKLGFKFKEVSHKCLIPFGILSCCLTIIVGASSFAYFEQWKYLDAVYYCVMTLSTIGFGDYVALQTNNALETDHQYVAFSLVYIMIGLAVIGAFLNLVILRMMVTLPDTPEGSQNGEDKASSDYSRESWPNEGTSSPKWKTFLRWGEEKSCPSDDDLSETSQPSPKYYLPKRRRSSLKRRHICHNDVTMNGHCCGEQHFMTHSCCFKPNNNMTSCGHHANNLKLESDVIPKSSNQIKAPVIEVNQCGEAPKATLSIPLSTSLLANPWDSHRLRYLSGDSGYSGGLGASRSRLSNSPVWSNGYPIAESMTSSGDVTSPHAETVVTSPQCVVKMTLPHVENVGSTQDVFYVTSPQSNEIDKETSNFIPLTSQQNNEFMTSPKLDYRNHSNILTKSVFSKSTYDVTATSPITKRRTRSTSPLALQRGDGPLVVFKKDTAQGGSVTMVREKNIDDVTTFHDVTKPEVTKEARKTRPRSPLIRQRVYPPFRPCIPVTSSEEKSLSHQDSAETAVTALTLSCSDGEVDDITNKKQLFSPEMTNNPETSFSLDKNVLEFDFNRKILELYSRSEEVTSQNNKEVRDSLDIPGSRDSRLRSCSEPTFDTRDLCRHRLTSSDDSNDDVIGRNIRHCCDNNNSLGKTRKRKRLKSVRSRMSGLKSSFHQPRGGGKEQAMSPLNPRNWINLSWFSLFQSKRMTSSDGAKVKFSPITPRASVQYNSSSDEGVTSRPMTRHKSAKPDRAAKGCSYPNQQTTSRDMTSSHDVTCCCRTLNHDVMNHAHAAPPVVKPCVCHNCKRQKIRSTI